MGRVPIGIAALAAVSAVLGIGLLLGAAYLTVARRDLGWIVQASAFALGPIVLYYAVQLYRLARWAWTATVIVMLLLLASSIAGAFLGPGFPGESFLEILAEVLALGYLSRAAVRRAFGGAGDPLSR